VTAGSVVWITGLPSSGKSTLARVLREKLESAGVRVCILDGDVVRKAVAPALAYTAEHRGAFYESLARLAALVAAQGLVVLVPATANRRTYRSRARELCPDFVEVWVDTPANECARRDTKGLYALCGKGRASELPGRGVDYQVPLAPDIVAHGGVDSAAISELVARLSSRQRARSDASRAAN
jgi:adenylylsulfate kinase